MPGPSARRAPSTLAALLVAAMPGTRPVAVGEARSGRDDVDAAVVHDEEEGVWLVLAPRTAQASSRLAAETEAVRLLAGVVPFDVPRPRADVELADGLRAVVFPAPRGRPIDLTRLAASPAVCRSVGRSVAALHDVTTAVVERAGVQVLDAAEVRRRRLADLDQGAGTGRVPPVLLQRWEEVLDDTTLWDFSPTVVHGDLVAERLVVTGEEVTAVLDWVDVHVGDPAEDLAWLAVGAEPETVDLVMEAYAGARHGHVDDELLARAVLHGEMALVRWLLHGVRTEDTGVQDDACGMLEQLAGWVEAEAEARRLERDRTSPGSAGDGPDGEAADDDATDDEADTAPDVDDEPDADEPDADEADADEADADEPAVDDAEPDSGDAAGGREAAERGRAGR